MTSTEISDGELTREQLLLKAGPLLTRALIELGYTNDEIKRVIPPHALPSGGRISLVGIDLGSGDLAAQMNSLAEKLRASVPPGSAAPTGTGARSVELTVGGRRLKATKPKTAEVEEGVESEMYLVEMEMAAAALLLELAREGLSERTTHRPTESAPKLPTLGLL